MSNPFRSPSPSNPVTGNHENNGTHNVVVNPTNDRELYDFNNVGVVVAEVTSIQSSVRAINPHEPVIIRRFGDFGNGQIEKNLQ